MDRGNTHHRSASRHLHDLQASAYVTNIGGMASPPQPFTADEEGIVMKTGTSSTVPLVLYSIAQKATVQVISTNPFPELVGTAGNTVAYTWYVAPNRFLSFYNLDAETNTTFMRNGTNFPVNLRPGSQLSPDGRFFLFEEVGTANGTWVGAERMANGVERELADGESIRFGRVDCVFRVGAG